MDTIRLGPLFARQQVAWQLAHCCGKHASGGRPQACLHTPDTCRLCMLQATPLSFYTPLLAGGSHGNCKGAPPTLGCPADLTSGHC